MRLLERAPQGHPSGSAGRRRRKGGGRQEDLQRTKRLEVGEVEVLQAESEVRARNDLCVNTLYCIKYKVGRRMREYVGWQAAVGVHDRPVGVRGALTAIARWESSSCRFPRREGRLWKIPRWDIRI